MKYVLLLIALACASPSQAATVVGQPTFGAYTTAMIGRLAGKLPTGGNAATATALAANGSNCSAGQAALGVDASGNAEGCWTPAGAYTLPTATSSVLGGVKPDGTSVLNTGGVLSATAASVGALATGGTATDSDKLDGQHGSYYQTALGYTAMKTDYSNAGTAPTWNQSTSGNAGTVTTNANLTGPITSTGNATAIASQTGTGSTFAMSADPLFTGTVTVSKPVAAGSTINSTNSAAYIYSSGTQTQASMFFLPLGFYNGYAPAAITVQSLWSNQSDIIFSTNVDGSATGVPTTTPLRLTGNGNVVVNGGSNTVYRCTGATNLGMLTINNALCVTGYATTSLNID